MELVSPFQGQPRPMNIFYPLLIMLPGTLKRPIMQSHLEKYCDIPGAVLHLLTNQGIPFVSKLLSDVCWLLQVKHIRRSVYHPQTNGLIKRFNQTLKRILRRVVGESGRN